VIKTNPKQDIKLQQNIKLTKYSAHLQALNKGASGAALCRSVLKNSGGVRYRTMVTN